MYLEMLTSIVKYWKLFDKGDFLKSDWIEFFCRSTCVSPVTRIADIVNRLGNKFISSFIQTKSSVNVEEQNECAKSRLMTGTKLFYKLIESILEHEKTINKDISVVFQEWYSFIVSLYYFSGFNSERSFLWMCFCLCHGNSTTLL